MASDDPSVRHVNERFYSSDPADYLETKLHLLILAGAKQAELGDLLVDGVEFSGVTLTFVPNDEPAQEPDLSSYLAIESQQLLHHAAETALRLYFAHIPGPLPPWIELASNRSFAKFKREVDDRLVRGRPTDDEVALVCLGAREPYADATQEAWVGAIDGIRTFLREFGRRFLDDAPIYNAIKHGVGVAPGAAVVLMDAHVIGSGTSLEFPEASSWDKANAYRDWSLTTRWIDMQESLALVEVAVRLIESIWAIGRYRHLGQQAGVDRVFFPTDMRPTDLRSKERAPMTRSSWRILRETRREDAPEVGDT